MALMRHGYFVCFQIYIWYVKSFLIYLRKNSSSFQNEIEIKSLLISKIKSFIVKKIEVKHYINTVIKVNRYAFVKNQSKSLAFYK